MDKNQWLPIVGALADVGLDAYRKKLMRQWVGTALCLCGVWLAQKLIQSR